MFRLVLISSLITLGLQGATLPVVPGDSEQGHNLFERERCIECHSIDGKGGKKAATKGKKFSAWRTRA